MYVSKQQPVTTAKISSEFQFNVLPNNYASFYDDQRQMWSVLFDKSDQLVNFAKQVCLAKYNSAQNSNVVVVQELQLGEQDTSPLKSGDSVEAKYTGWLVQPQNGTLGSVFDSNHKTEKTFRFKTGKGKVIKGWEEGMLGLKRGGKRFLVIPPALAYGSKGAGNKVPPNSTLAFEVDILRIKHQGTDNSVQQSNSVESVPQSLAQASEPEPSFGQNLEVPFGGMPTTGEETVKGRTASFNEQLAHQQVDSSKAKLLSRMAKVGQPMLPPKPSAVAHSQEPDTGPTQPMAVSSQVHAQAPSQSQTHQAVAPVAHTPPQQPQMQMTREISQSPAYPAISPVAIDQTYMHNPHATFQHSGHSISPHSTFGMMQSNPVLSHFQQSSGIMPYAGIQPSTFNHLQAYSNQTGADFLPAILSESQKQSSDMKVLLDKMEKVSDKVSAMMKVSESQQLNISSADNMDAALLSHNIQRIVQENEKMKKKVLEKNKQIETQSDKIADLLQQNQKLVEESHAQMEKRNTSFKETFGQTQERTLQLEKEKVELTSKLSDATSKICELQLNVVNMTDRANSLEKLVKVSSTEAESKQTADQFKYQEMENQLSQASKQLEILRSDKMKLEKLYQDKSSSADEEASQKLGAAQLAFEEEKTSLLQQIEKLKESHSAEMQSLQEKYQSESSGAVGVKNELEARWREKCKEAVTTVTKAAEAKLNEVNEEKDELEQKIEAYQKKFLQLRKMYEEKLKSEEELTEKVEELESIQERYGKLRNQAVAMKEKYEETIAELRESSQESQKTDVDVTDQIKSVMNDVFRQINSNISSDEEYEGSEVMGVVLNVIKSTTLKILQPASNLTEQSENESEGEEEMNGEAEKTENVNEKIIVDSEKTAENETSEIENYTEKNVEDDVVNSVTDTAAPVVEDQDSNVSDEAKESDDQRNEVGKISTDVKDEKEVKEIVEQQTSEEQIEIIHQLDQTEEEKAVVSQVQLVTNDPDEKAEEKISSEQNESEKDEVDNKTEPVDNKLDEDEERSQSPDIIAKPSPPPLFDDDEEDEDDDLNWLK
uniref:FK506-binding protein 15-like n=1 Tax=Styela clava TaxID=7725 RepID=UPI001939ABFA|nr:FK506-binding protein 15-like [Styela clava]